MKVNPTVEGIVRGYIESYLLTHGQSTLEELLENYNGPHVNEAEFRNVIKNALAEGYLETSIADGSKCKKIRLSRSFPPPAEYDFRIVISKPRLQELGLLSLQLRNDFVDSVDCFRTLIDTSRYTLRICSPFLQANVCDKEVFPDLNELLANAFNRGVSVFVLSRELFSRRGSEMAWIVELAQNLDRSQNLKIVDYHLQNTAGRVLSSTHAKLLVSDSKSAYVGSAELRKNSLNANFEVGCFITGPQVIGICEIFDAMFSAGKSWYEQNPKKH